jgi:hypothetical protein
LNSTNTKQAGDLSFSAFKEKWKEKNFQLIHKINKFEFDPHELFNALSSIPLGKDILPLFFSFFPYKKKNKKVLFCRINEIRKRIGFIYVLYTLYHTQIIHKEKKEKINITLGKKKKSKIKK